MQYKLFARFVPLLAAGNLFWEALQLPFYTIGREDSPQERLIAVLHCTAGDVMIGTASLFFAVLLFGRGGWPNCRHGAVAPAAVVFGIAYTIFSEWLNTEITMSWKYADSMPLVPPFGTGIAPLLQWIIVPPLAYWVARAGNWISASGESRAPTDCENPIEQLVPIGRRLGATGTRRSCPALIAHE